jgi:tetratricopeptide (TPR) repeat protein
MDHNNDVVGGPDVVGIKSPHKRRRWLWVIVVLVLIVLLGGCYFTYRHVHNNSNKVTLTDAGTIQSQTDSIAEKHGAQAALTVYKQKIPNAANNTVKAELDLQAGAIALNANMYSTALSYALQSYNLNPTSNSSALVATIYQQEGNTTQAVKYFKIAASEVHSITPGGPTASSYLQEAQDAESGASQ